MRKRSLYCVCHCTPTDGITHIEARLLHDMINRQIHALFSLKNCRWKYKRGLYMGDLCASSGHPWWAMKVWCLAMALIIEKDYDDWIYEWINPKYVSIRGVLSEEESLILARRIDDLWRKLGHPEKVGMEEVAKGQYDDFWYEKYDYDRNCFHEDEAEEREYEERQQTAALFREGQGGDWLGVRG